MRSPSHWNFYFTFHDRSEVSHNLPDLLTLFPHPRREQFYSHLKSNLKFICISVTLVLDSDFKTLKMHANEQVNSRSLLVNSQHCWPDNVGRCCVRLHKAKSLNGFTLAQQLATTRNNTQQHAAWRANGRNVQHVTSKNVASILTGLQWKPPYALHPCRSIRSQIFNASTLVCFWKLIF